MFSMRSVSMGWVGLLAMVGGAQSTLGCGTSVNGTTVECGSHWIRYKQGSDSFEQFKHYGSRGYVRRGQIGDGCLVFGPFVSAPFAGSLVGWIKLEALVDVATITTPGPFGVPISRLQSGHEMFTMDMVTNAGNTVLGRKIVRFGDMTTWTGPSTPYSRCTAADPCTAGGPGHATRTFKMYRNTVTLDAFARTLQGPVDKIELRVCGLNRLLTKLRVDESVIELNY